MKKLSTDHLLTLGMALYGDKSAMERRVRGVFARRKSPNGVRALALILCLMLGVGCFTTACSAGSAPAASAGDAAVSGGDALVSGGDALASDGNAAEDSVYTKEMALRSLASELTLQRQYMAPRVGNAVKDELGSWIVGENVSAADTSAATTAFLTLANRLFNTQYTEDDMIATLYLDETGNRSDLWRIDSSDGVLCGALEAGTLKLISADCATEPSDTLHESLQDRDTSSEWYAWGEDLDLSDAVGRIAGILGDEAGTAVVHSGVSRRVLTNGWDVRPEFYFPLGDGTYCLASVFGDENLTLTAVGICEDEACAIESVFWRADLLWEDEITVMKDPQDFRPGEPGADDMTKEEALAFYRTLVDTAGIVPGTDAAVAGEPETQFYIDYSGARENYWHVEGAYASFDLTSQTGRMLNMTSDGKLGSALGLTGIAYEDMGNQTYLDATEALFNALFGEGSVVKVELNAVYDDHYCTTDPIMADGTSYEIQFGDGLIIGVTAFAALDETGFGADPNWAADWIYVNTETGEEIHMQW